MTTIAVRRMFSKNGRSKGVVFACDDRLTSGSQMMGFEEKVFTVGPVTFGFAGSVRDLNLIRHALKIPAFSKKDAADPQKWVVRKLIPAMKKTLESHGSLETHSGYSTSDSSMIISVGAMCGHVSHDFALYGTEEDFWSVGSGSAYAIGAMTMGATAAEAVTVAGLHDSYTGSVEREVKVRW